jgi:hypothetical protein
MILLFGQAAVSHIGRITYFALLSRNNDLKGASSWSIRSGKRPKRPALVWKREKRARNGGTGDRARLNRALLAADAEL